MHDQHAFSGDHFLDQIQFHSHVEIADELAWLQKRAANVVIADEGVCVRNFQFLSKAEGGVISGVGDRYNNICLDRKLACELAPHFHSDFSNINAADHAVRAREVNVFEHAPSILRSADNTLAPLSAGRASRCKMISLSAVV